METKTEDTLFTPVITNTGNDSGRAAKAALRSLFTTLLGLRECAEAIAPFKNEGRNPMGHKVLDDSGAVNALLASAPPALADAAKNVSGVTQWDRCQVLNQVLRRHFAVNKYGKLTGEPSKRLQEAMKEAA